MLTNAGGKFILFLLFILIGYIGVLILSVLSIFLYASITGSGPISYSDFMNQADILLAINSASSVLTFLLPSLITAYLISPTPSGYLSSNSFSPSFILPLTMLSAIIVMPFTSLVATWNDAIHFPEWMSFIETALRDQQKMLADMTAKLTVMDNISRLFIVLFCIAVVPAICEEFFFRGFLQRFIQEITNKKHLAVWITAAIFSAIHFEFFAFIPRLLLGAWLGYLLLFTRSIWISVAAHFTNNATFVILLYLQQHGILGKEVEQIGTGDTLWVSYAAFFLFLGLQWVVQRQAIKE
ncbi:MAG: CPBP family intramembrane metalloprotease [Bacteroidales bacterium]|nr:CPBP family intramembrane metalloprotease [Bacteroidales bacterium]